MCCDLPFSEEDPRTSAEPLETLVWTSSHSLTDRQIDQFLVISRSVGTFARALDCSSSVKQPSLHMSAAAASRDITLVSGVLIVGHLVLEIFAPISFTNRFFVSVSVSRYGYFT